MCVNRGISFLSRNILQAHTKCRRGAGGVARERCGPRGKTVRGGGQRGQDIEIAEMGGRGEDEVVDEH